MGLLDSVLGSVMGGLSGQQQQQPANPMLSIVLQMLAAQGQGQGQGAGGLGGLMQIVQMFQQKGMGDVVQSWIGTGQNMPISADQIINVLGHGQVASMAEQAGVSHAEAADSLSQLLPGLIDKLTPQGQVPHQDDLSTQLGGLLGMLRR